MPVKFQYFNQMNVVETQKQVKMEKIWTRIFQRFDIFRASNWVKIPGDFNARKKMSKLETSATVKL